MALDPNYGRLKNHLIASTGLAFYEGREQLLAALIAERLSVLQLGGCAAYTAFLADGEAGRAEMDVLIAELTNGETSFFRDEEHYAAIRDVILPDIIGRKQSSRQLHIWSAGCASGAEPYSLAILLERALGEQAAGWEIVIRATDLNRSSLARAAAGKFREWALRSTSAAIRSECFSQHGLSWTILPRYQRWISFHYMNLAAKEFSTPWPSDTAFDLILCRNVMIYFAPGVNRWLVGQLHRSLSKGGWLVVGAAECNLENYLDFRMVNAVGARLYQKPSLPCAPPARLPETPPLRLLAAPPPPDAPHPGDMEDLRQLADRGDWAGAAEHGQRLLALDRLNPAIHFYRALIFENLGSLGEAERSLRQAIYLDRNFALAHYHLGLALRRDRKSRSATRSFENVLRVLSGLADDAIVAAGPGVTAASLRELARMQMEPAGKLNGRASHEL